MGPLNDWAQGLERDIDGIQGQLDKLRRDDDKPFGVIADRLKALEGQQIKLDGFIRECNRKIGDFMADDEPRVALRRRLKALESWRKNVAQMLSDTINGHEKRLKEIEEALPFTNWPAPDTVVDPNLPFMSPTHGGASNANATEAAAKEVIWPEGEPVYAGSGRSNLPPDRTPTAVKFLAQLGSVASRLRMVPEKERRSLGLESLLGAVVECLEDHNYKS